MIPWLKIFLYVFYTYDTQIVPVKLPYLSSFCRFFCFTYSRKAFLNYVSFACLLKNFKMLCSNFIKI